MQLVMKHQFFRNAVNLIFNNEIIDPKLKVLWCNAELIVPLGYGYLAGSLDNSASGVNNAVGVLCVRF